MTTGRPSLLIAIGLLVGVLVGLGPITAQAQASFTFGALKALIVGDEGPTSPGKVRLMPADSAEQLLSRLPDELLSNFTFVHFSRTPHGFAASPPEDASVSPVLPRLILFTPDARLIVALTGDPSKPDYDVVETLHFEDTEAAFHTAKFVLPAAIARRPGLSPSSNGRLDAFECTRCHGKDPRPIFDSYNLWPGFYGARADAIGADPFERENYPKFLAAQRNASTGIYRWLHWPAGTATPPFLEMPVKLGEIEKLALSPNTRLGMALTELNRARLFRLIRSSPRYPSLRYALVAGLVGCQKLPYDKALLRGVAARVARYELAKFKRAGFKDSDPVPTELRMEERFPDDVRNLTEIFYIAEALGLDRSEWSLAFEPKAPAFFDGILSGDSLIGSRPSYYLKEDFLLEMLKGLAAEDPDFRRYTETNKGLGTLPFGNRLRLEPLNLDGSLCRLLKSRTSASSSRLPKVRKLKL